MEVDKYFVPYEYQRKLTEEFWPDLLDILIGSGKTVYANIFPHKNEGQDDEP